MRAFFSRFLEKGEGIRQFERECDSLRARVEDLRKVQKRVPKTSDQDGLFV